MHVVPITAKPSRKQHRHSLRTLTYVTLDDANGGIVRNLNHTGLAVQTVAPVRPGQQVRVRFELRQPRVPIEARGEVSWADSKGQAGIRFLDLPPRKMRQLNEWIFGNLLESLPQHSLRSGGLFGISRGLGESASDGLIVSSAPRTAIRLENNPVAASMHSHAGEHPIAQALDLDWLSRPLSGTALALAIDTLIVFAAMLLFFLVFFAVSSGFPEWPMNIGLGFATAIFVAAFYWGLFHTLAGTTLGFSLARLAESDFDGGDHEKSPRFR